MDPDSNLARQADTNRPPNETVAGGGGGGMLS